jgi:hypothetical protein
MSTLAYYRSKVAGGYGNIVKKANITIDIDKLTAQVEKNHRQSDFMSPQPFPKTKRHALEKICNFQPILSDDPN